MSTPVGTVYLLHFDRPYRHAAHYTGWTANLSMRLAEHATGRGARLLEVVTAAGIGFTLARTWPDATRADERALKRQGGASRRCPVCTGHAPAAPPTAAAVPTPRVLPADPPDATCEVCDHTMPPYCFDLFTTDRWICLDCRFGAPARRRRRAAPVLIPLPALA